jgi:hypothetical protein
MPVGDEEVGFVPPLSVQGRSCWCGKADEVVVVVVVTIGDPGGDGAHGADATRLEGPQADEMLIGGVATRASEALGRRAGHLRRRRTERTRNERTNERLRRDADECRRLQRGRIDDAALDAPMRRDLKARGTGGALRRRSQLTTRIVVSRKEHNARTTLQKRQRG